MREARDVFLEVGYEERKLGVLQVLLLFDGIFFIFVYLIVFIVFVFGSFLAIFDGPKPMQRPCLDLRGPQSEPNVVFAMGRA